MIDKSKLKKVCIYNKEETISNKILNLQNSKEKKIEIQSSKLKTFKIAVPSKVSKYTSLEKLKQITKVSDNEPIIDIIIPYKKRHKSISLTRVEDYEQKENEHILSFFGCSLFQFIKNIEMNQITPDLLARHRITPELRTKMIDWMIEVFSVFNFSESCFFLSVNIFDMFIANTSKILLDDDIHLLGMTCMFIASKFEESRGLRLDFVYEKIGYRTFDKTIILHKEIEIVKTIGFENLICTSAGEFISSFCFDFIQNNKVFVDKYSIKPLIKKLELNSLYYAKMLTHFDIFNNYSSSLRALACLIVSFDQIRHEKLVLTPEEESYIREWLKYILHESKFDDQIKLIYSQINDAMDLYNSLDFIGFHLNQSYNKQKDLLSQTLG